MVPIRFKQVRRLSSPAGRGVYFVEVDSHCRAYFTLGHQTPKSSVLEAAGPGRMFLPPVQS